MRERNRWRRRCAPAFAMALITVVAACTETRPVEATLYQCTDANEACAVTSATAMPVARLVLLRTAANGRHGPADEFCSAALQRLVGNDQHVEMWLDEQRTLTALPGGRSITLNDSTKSFTIACLSGGEDFYARSCLEDAATGGFDFDEDVANCTPIHRIHIPDDRSEDQGSANSRGRIAARLELLPRLVSCLQQTVAGVQICYDWDIGEFLLWNQSDTAVHLTLDVPDRGLVAVDQYYLVAGARERVPSPDLQAGDTVRARAWVGYLESVIDRLLGDRADVEITFVMTRTPEIPVASVATAKTLHLTLERTAGVDCELLARQGTANETSNLPADLYCENRSSDDVRVQLYALRAGTDTTYAWAYELTEFLLVLNTDQIEKLSDTVGDGAAYALIVQSVDLLDSDILREQVSGFRLDLRAGRVLAIDDDQLPAGAP